MKMSDEEYDENSNKLISSFLGMVTGLICGYLASHDINAIYLFLGILISSLISLKIDGIHHITSLIFFLMTFMFFGIGNLNLFTLAICVISGFIDEIGNDNEYIYKRSSFFKVFFDYRFAMKIAILLLSVLGLINILYGFSIDFIGVLAPETIIYFLFFEIFYEVGNKTFKKYLLQ
ncbi:MAG: hypothetical protein LBB45_06325 [Methanobrevibacter sp.]|nr:hypothetical protein [Candidatus Methanovirga basalitermitum]